MPAPRSPKPSRSALPLAVVLGQVIARLRAKAGFSQEGFAAHAGFHRVYMGKIERGQKDMRLSTLERIADALGVTTGQLLRNAERKHVTR